MEHYSNGLEAWTQAFGILPQCEMATTNVPLQEEKYNRVWVYAHFAKSLPIDAEMLSHPHQATLRVTYGSYVDDTERDSDTKMIS